MVIFRAFFRYATINKFSDPIIDAISALGSKADVVSCDCAGGVCDEECKCAKVVFNRVEVSSFELAGRDLPVSMGEWPLSLLKAVINFLLTGRIMEKFDEGVGVCTHNCRCNGKCARNFANEELRPLVQLTFSASKGFGVITTCDIPRGAFISRYIGHYSFSQETVKRIRRHVIDLDFAYRIIGDQYAAMVEIDAERYGNVGRFYNHSCSPNMFVQPIFDAVRDEHFITIAFFAARDIGAGEELTWDYGYERPEKGHKRTVRCLCDEANCMQWLF